MHTFGPNPSSLECPLVYTILAKVSKDTQWVSVFRYNNDDVSFTDLFLSAAGCVSCLEYDEHYILTFPNGYGRWDSTICLSVLSSHEEMSCVAYIILRVSFQVDPDRSMGGVRWRVQYFLLQIWLQCQHSVPHQTFLWGKEAQDNRRHFVSQ